MQKLIPPMLNGVSASTLYLEKITNPPATIFEFLCQKFSHIDKTIWQMRFLNRLIFNQEGKALTLDSPYQHGVFIYYYREVKDEIVVPFDYQIIFENHEFIVVDKPHFLPVTPSGRYVSQTLLTRLKYDTKNPDLSPIHRLDKETAGLILISKNPHTRGAYQALFSQHKINKLYHAIAPFKAELTFPQTIALHLQRGTPFYVMQISPEKEPNSFTQISIIKHNDKFAKYQLIPTTGKLHQLRVHMNHLGIAIKNDGFYPKIFHKAGDDFSSPLQLLAKELVFCDPISQKLHHFYSKQALHLP